MKETRPSTRSKFWQWPKKKKKTFLVITIRRSINLISNLFYFPDEVIRKRLLIEGESGADDRRINTLLKNFMKWCNSPADDEDR